MRLVVAEGTIVNLVHIFRMLIFHRIIMTSIVVHDFIFICLMAEIHKDITLM